MIPYQRKRKNYFDKLNCTNVIKYYFKQIDAFQIFVIKFFISYIWKSNSSVLFYHITLFHLTQIIHSLIIVFISVCVCLCTVTKDVEKSIHSVNQFDHLLYFICSVYSSIINHFSLLAFVLLPINFNSFVLFSFKTWSYLSNVCRKINLMSLFYECNLKFRMI